ncbi:MAG: hypothetical protein WCV63_01640 [Negativicutes bacterium]|jgi:hypothetical protein
MFPESLAVDGRINLDELYSRLDILETFGWTKQLVTEQTLERNNDTVKLPVYAYSNAQAVDWVVIGGIHGREPAGTNAISEYVRQLVELGKTREILVLPLCNPWGYLEHNRYGPYSQSVGDSDHLLGRADTPACPEAGAITNFVTEMIKINANAAVLDLHEDPVYEAEGYVLDRWGTYLYISGCSWQASPIAKRVIEYLKTSMLPLIIDGVTRFDETIADGIVPNTEDGSIDELLYKRGACPVITVENILHSETNPPLTTRTATYRGVLEAFFGN